METILEPGITQGLVEPDSFTLEIMIVIRERFIETKDHFLPKLCFTIFR